MNEKNDTLLNMIKNQKIIYKEIKPVDYISKINVKDIFEKYTGKNKSDIINQQKLIKITDELDAIIQYLICKIKYNRKDYEKMKFYYIIIKSQWETFPNNERIRVKTRISSFYYDSKEEAMKVAAKLRKKDPYYRYDLGDRIYVRRR